MLLALRKPTGGRITVFGTDPYTCVKSGRVGAMLQSGGLMPEVTVRELVTLVTNLHPKPEPVDVTLKRAGIAQFADQRVDRLSGGQTQRVRFALAICGKSELIVLDEPTTAMDVETRRLFWASMKEEVAQGRTLLFATHYLEEADQAGLAMIGFRMQMVLMRELAQARGTVAKLAANEERLRLGRDMHDLTGQSLSMITLKSDLAAKRLARLPPSAERDAVLGELGDIGRVSRQTLHDIREAVSGYRRPTLAIEVITARNALEAAAIRLDDDPALTLRSGTFDPDTEAVLAWCLREAVTNVIRHSGAKSCRIRLSQQGGELSLEVTDDGHGLAEAAPAPQDRPAPQASQEPRGSGLRGISERLSAVGGRLSLGPADPGGARRGFRLTASVPRYTRNPAHAAGHDCEV